MAHFVFLLSLGHVAENLSAQGFSFEPVGHISNLYDGESTVGRVLLIVSSRVSLGSAPFRQTLTCRGSIPHVGPSSLSRSAMASSVIAWLATATLPTRSPSRSTVMVAASRSS